MWSEGAPHRGREVLVFRAVEQRQHLSLAQAFQACPCLKAFALTVVSAESCLSPRYPHGSLPHLIVGPVQMSPQ